MIIQRLSKTSPYVCDLNRGPIEPANRMAASPTTKITALLEPKESFPKTRAPLKLLGLEEVPMDTTMATTDNNASLQPVWYTEQTIVDDHGIQQDGNMSMNQEKLINSRTTLPPIQSESPSTDEAMEEEHANQSSTFTIESSVNLDSMLNDLEKENIAKDNQTTAAAPSEDSFRALEHLLGLGSTPTASQQSPKITHDTLSLTVVTPTDIINSTTTSLRRSYARKTRSDNLPLSQEIPVMTTIESNTSSNPPSFLIDNTTMELEPTMNENNSLHNSSKDEDEGNFSFELNDFSNNSKVESTMDIPAPTIRAPTCADVAYRALIKTRTSRRVSQPIKADSPLAITNKARSSAPSSRFLRSSCRRISSDTPATVQDQIPASPECFVKNGSQLETEPFEMVSVPEEIEHVQENPESITMNLTPILSEDKSMQQIESPQQKKSIRVKKSMQPQNSVQVEVMQQNLSMQSIQSPQHNKSLQQMKSIRSKKSIQPEEIQQNTSMQQFASPQGNKSIQGKVSMQPIPSLQSNTSMQLLFESPLQNKSIQTKKSLVPKNSIQAENAEQNIALQPIATQQKTSMRGRKSAQGNSSVQLEEIQHNTSMEQMNSPQMNKSIQPIASIQGKQSMKPIVSIKPIASIQGKQSMKPMASMQGNTSMQLLFASPVENKSTRRSKSMQPKNSIQVEEIQQNSSSMQQIESPQPNTSIRGRKSVKQNQSVQQDEFSTPSKPLMPLLSREYTYNTPKRASSVGRRSKMNMSSLKQQPTTHNSTLNSTSMLNTDLLYQMETESKPLQPLKSQRTMDKSMNNNSMLKVLLTNRTDAEQSDLQETIASTTMESTIDRNSMRQSKRLSSNLTPRVSINPLHSSTPSSTKRHKPLQMVSIGEQEQVSTTVPQQVPIEIDDVPQMMEESMQQEATIIRTVEMGVQTTPSLNVSTRRQMQIVEQQQQVTPIQTKIVVNLQRNVRFELTPETDARLIAKEKLEENLRGLKPDIVIHPIPMIPQPKPQIAKPAKVTRSKNLKKKRLASKPKPVEKKAKVTRARKPVLTSNNSKKKAELVKKVVEEKAAIVKTTRTPRKRSTVETTVEPASKRAKPVEVEKPTVESKKQKSTGKNKKPAEKSVKTKERMVSRKAKKTEEKPAKPERKSRSSSGNKKHVSEPVQEPAKVEKKTKKTAAKPIIEESKAAVASTDNVINAVEQSKKQSKSKKGSKTNKKNASKPIEEETKAQIQVPVSKINEQPEKARSASRTNKKPVSEPIVHERKTRSASNSDKKNTSQSKPARTSTNNKNMPSKSYEIESKTAIDSNDSKKDTTETTKEQESKSQTKSVNDKKKGGKTNKKQIKAETEVKITESNVTSKKRRLPSIEKSEVAKKKDDKENVESVPAIQTIELNAEQRKKIEDSTVAQLKSRLTKHKVDVPKGGKKADLVALLIKTETNLIKEQKPVETIKVNTTSMATRRRNK